MLQHVFPIIVMCSKCNSLEKFSPVTFLYLSISQQTPPGIKSHLPSSVDCNKELGPVLFTPKLFQPFFGLRFACVVAWLIDRSTRNFVR